MTKFYGIGVGPGDEELVTVKAVKVIKKLDVLYAPLPLKNGVSTAEKIISTYIEKNTQIKRRYFPMNFDNKEKKNAWKEIASEIIKDVKCGKNVGFITLGNPMIYSTYIYLLEIIKDKVCIETIPGIASFSNIASTNNYPLAIDNDKLAILPGITKKEDLNKLFKINDSIVIMKVYKNFKTIIETLDENDLIESAIMVSNSSMEDEKIYTDLREVYNMEKIPYFSTILINKRKDKIWI